MPCIHLHRRWPLQFAIAFVMHTLFLGGCSTGDLPQRVPVQGVVTFDGGPCPAPGIVSFAPLDVPGGLPRRPASGKFASDGQFTVTSYHDGDGLVPGRYRVHVECWKREPQPIPGDAEKATYVPLDYELPELVIDASMSPVHVDYDVPLASAP